MKVTPGGSLGFHPGSIRAPWGTRTLQRCGLPARAGGHRVAEAYAALRPLVEPFVAARTLYELSSEAQAGFSALAEESWKSYTKGVAAWVEKASQAAPAGSDVALNAFRSTIAASTAAFDQFQKATKQVVSLADANFRAAATNGTTPKGRKAA